MKTTSTFRDYGIDSFGGGVFSINTSGQWAELTLALNDPEFAVTYKFSRDTARELGTDLLRWTGGPCTCTLEPVDYPTIEVAVAANGKWLRVEVIDGTVMFLLRGGLSFQVTDTEAVDLAQRLIVWAGVVNAPVNA